MIDITALSKERKLQLYDLIQEEKRRRQEKGISYAPNRGQEPVHKSQAQIRVVLSGNGAGKTALGTNEAIWWSDGYNPVTNSFTKVPARTIVVLDHPEKVTDQWLPELQKWTHIPEDHLHKRGKPYVNRITRPNGSEILFMFHDQNPLQFESIETDYVIFDEPPPRSLWVALRRGARKKNRTPRFLLIGTPISGAWIRRDLYDPWVKGEMPNVECFRFSTDVNEGNLADNYVSEFGALLTEKEKRIRLHGEFFDLEGLALAHLFDRDVHIIPPFEWDSRQPCVVAIDPHPVKSHHAIMLGCDEDGYLYYLKEIKKKAVARDFGRAVRDWMQGYRVVDTVVDSLGSAESTGGEGFKSFIQILNEPTVGVRCRATTWTEKSDDDFIDRIRSALAIPDEPDNFGQNVPQLRIFEGNHGIISNIENVQWVKYRDHDEFKPKLDITDKDFLSCLKYGLAAGLSPLKGKATIYRHNQIAGEAYGLRKNNPLSWKANFRRIKARYENDDDEENWSDF